MSNLNGYYKCSCCGDVDKDNPCVLKVPNMLEDSEEPEDCAFGTRAKWIRITKKEFDKNT
jgi:hypothetical protein